MSCVVWVLKRCFVWVFSGFYFQIGFYRPFISGRGLFLPFFPNILVFFPKFSGGDGGKWRDIAHLTLGGYSPYYFFMVLVTIPLLLLLILSLLMEDWPAWIVFVRMPTLYR